LTICNNQKKVFEWFRDCWDSMIQGIMIEHSPMQQLLQLRAAANRFLLRHIANLVHMMVHVT
jgi:hypothetical protein